MHGYLTSKAAEYCVILDWLEAEIERLRDGDKNHAQIFSRLQNILTGMRQQHWQLQVISSLGNARLAQRALPIIHNIELGSFVLSQYIPGLQRENADDLFVRSLLLFASKSCGLSWIEDILVRLDNQHAIWPGITEIPVIFAPPQQANTTLDFAALYHELGHNVFQRFPEIARTLGKKVNDYYFELKQSAGAMAPEKRKARDMAIENAKSYWTVERLNEMFSDIYATFACGPAHYFSCVDVAMRLEGNPSSINLADVHPPWAARVYACIKTLLPVYRDDKLVARIGRVWDLFHQTKNPDPAFELLCPRNLIERLVDVSTEYIKRLLPEAKRYSAVLDIGVNVEEGANLEMILNERVRILINKPDQYGDWEKKVFDVLRKETLAGTL